MIDDVNSVAELGARVPPPAQPPEPYTIWNLTTTFRRDGSPVMGSLGSSTGQVIVMNVETFKRLVREHPSLATAQFRVGERD